MAYTLQCTNAGCGRLNQPYIDRETDKIYCSECHNELATTIFIRNQLKMHKQYRQREKQSFSVKCNQCQAEQRPIIIAGEICCSSCQKVLNQLTPTFIIMLKQNLSKAGQDI